MERILCIVIGYVFGLFQTGYIYGKLNNVDIRDHGSGNAGTTNALRTLGVKAGAITFIGDCFKCVIAVLIANLIFGNSHSEYMKVLDLYAAAGAILGHNYPFYLKFRGGKGIAATAGLIVSFHWVLVAVCLPVFLIVFLTTHYVSLGSLLVYTALVVTVLIMGQTGYLGLEQAYLNEIYVIAILLAILAFWKHRANISRLLKGTENKTYLKKKK